MSCQAYIEVTCSTSGFVLVTASADMGPGFFAALGSLPSHPMRQTQSGLLTHPLLAHG